jgi:hypothetical protein
MSFRAKLRGPLNGLRYISFRTIQAAFRSLLTEPTPSCFCFVQVSMADHDLYLRRAINYACPPNIGSNAEAVEITDDHGRFLLCELSLNEDWRRIASEHTCLRPNHHLFSRRGTLASCGCPYLQFVTDVMDTRSQAHHPLRQAPVMIIGRRTAKDNG